MSICQKDKKGKKAKFYDGIDEVYNKLLFQINRLSLYV